MTERGVYRCVAEASSAVVARESGAVDDLVFTVRAGESRFAITLVTAKTNVTTDSSVQTRRVCSAVVQVYTFEQCA